MTSPLQSFCEGYYKRPEPSLARDAFLEFGQTANHASLPVLPFAIAFACDRRIRQAIEDFGPLTASSKTLFERVLAASDVLPDPATMPIREPSDLDALWAFFLTTGAGIPVQRIAAVLNSDDQMSDLVQQWLEKPGILSAASRLRSKARLIHVGILSQQGAIPRSERDLDLHVWKLMSQGFQVRTELPFALTDGYIQHLALRGAACWSLQSNAQTHELVREVYLQSPRAALYPLFI